MTSEKKSASGSSTARLRFGNALAIVSFVLAGGLLVWLELWAWRDSIEPHIALVRRLPIAAEILNHSIEESGVGEQGSAYPHATYRYVVDGRDYQSSVIWPPQFVDESGESYAPQFDGPNRRQLAQALLDQFPIGQTVTAWVDSKDPTAAMLVQQRPSFAPFLWGVLPAIFVPVLWLLIASALKSAVSRPRGRWLATGWSVLTLVCAIPIVRQYKTLVDFQSNVASRLLDVGIGLAIVVFISSLLPRFLRSGLAIGLIVSFCCLGGVGTALAAFLTRNLGLIGWQANPPVVFVQCLEYALIGGVVLGLLLAIGIRCGFIWVQSDETFEKANQ